MHTFKILNVLAISIAVAIAMAPPLAPPKGFKFRRFFSRADPNGASTSQVPPSVPPVDDASVQPATPLGDSSIKKKSYEKSRQFQVLWLPLFPWAEPIYKDEEVTKVGSVGGQE